MCAGQNLRTYQLAWDYTFFLLPSTYPDDNIEYTYIKITCKNQDTQNRLYFQRFTHIEDLQVICFNVIQATLNIKKDHYWVL